MPSIPCPPLNEILLKIFMHIEDSNIVVGFNEAGNSISTSPWSNRPAHQLICVVDNILATLVLYDHVELAGAAKPERQEVVVAVASTLNRGRLNSSSARRRPRRGHGRRPCSRARRRPKLVWRRSFGHPTSSASHMRWRGSGRAARRLRIRQS